MDEKLPVVEIVVESWRLAARAFVPSLPWLGLLMALAGLYRLVLGMDFDRSAIVALNLMAAVFFAGVAYSLSTPIWPSTWPSCLSASLSASSS